MVIVRNLRKDRSATSPVMGVLMMVAIVVVLAAVIAGFALAVKVPERTPQAIIAIDSAQPYKSSSNATLQHIELYHKGGDSFNVTDIRVTIVVNGEIIPYGLDALPITGGVTGFNGALGGVFNNGSNSAPVWEVGEKASFNIGKTANGSTNKELFDGDKVTAIIVYKPSKMIIARPSAIVQDLR